MASPCEVTCGDETGLVDAAVEWIHRRAPEGFVTYNDVGFALTFLRARLGPLGVEADLDLAGRHVDLFTERQRLADLADERWPALEEYLKADGLPFTETVREGDVPTNARFGEELTPRYLTSLRGLEFDRVRALEAVIRTYASADIVATLALYEADLGQ